MILMRGLFPALLGMNQLISRAASFLSFYEMMIQNIDYGSKFGCVRVRVDTNT